MLGEKKRINHVRKRMPLLRVAIGLAIVATPICAQPAITSVVTASSHSAQIAQNTWIEVYGTNLSQTTLDWSKSNFSDGLPTALAGVSATVNGKAAAIYYVSPTQVNLLTPLDDATGTVSVQLKAPNGLTSVKTVTELASSPAFLVIDATGHVAARHVDYSLVGPPSLSVPGYTFTPAKPGETVLLYATGFGQTSPPINNQMSGLGSLLVLPGVTIGGVPAAVAYAGLSAAGLYQFNVTIPTNAANGDLPLVATYNGSSTQSGVVVTVAAPSSPTGPNGQNVTLSVTNKLIYPVDVTVNGTVVNRVAASSSSAVKVAGSYGMQVGYELVRPTTTSGTPEGEQMTGIYPALTNPSGTLSYVVNNVLGGQAYFAPFIHNTSGVGALMGVNMGLLHQNECNCIIGATGTSTIGYYKLFPNSNVRAYPASSNYSASSGYAYWGQDPTGAPNATFPAVAADTGAVTLNLVTAPGTGAGGGNGGGSGSGTAGTNCGITIPYKGYGANWVCILLTNTKNAGYWNGSLSSPPQLPALHAEPAQRDTLVESAVISAFVAASNASNPTKASTYAHSMIENLQTAFSYCSDSSNLGGTLVTLNLFGCSVAPNPVPAQ
jgi:uncharacterized protein (TIGR03437 family)